MQMPKGFQNRFGPGFVLQLKRALYGLKQAGHQWHKKLNSVLTSLDFKLMRCDNSIWVYQNGQSRVIVPVYVDDMTITCKSHTEYEQLARELKKHFKLKELGPLSSLLGVSIERDRSKHRLMLSQHLYITDVLQTFGLADVRPVTTPLDPGAKLSKDQAPQNDEERQQMKNIPYSQLTCRRSHVSGYCYSSRHCLCGGSSCMLQQQSWFCALDSSQAPMSLSARDKRLQAML